MHSFEWNAYNYWTDLLINPFCYLFLFILPHQIAFELQSKFTLFAATLAERDSLFIERNRIILIQKTSSLSARLKPLESLSLIMRHIGLPVLQPTD